MRWRLAAVFGCAAILGSFAGCASDPSAPSSELADVDAGGTGTADGGTRDASGDPPKDAGSDADAAPSTYAIKVTVTGLSAATGDAGLDDAGAGGLVLQNGNDRLSVFQDGTFTFATKVAAGGTFDVTIAEQPSNPLHACVVSGGKGTVVSGDVQSITVNCDLSKFTVGGSVAGLAGGGLQVRINDTENVAIAVTDGTYAFPTSIASGTPYEVVVLDQPTNLWQTCSVANAKGIVDDANVTNVDVTCTTNTYTISGTITGLVGGGLALVDTYGGGGGPETIQPASGATTFAFTQPVKSGEMYTVSVGTQPEGLFCEMTANGSGTIAGANVTDVAVACVPLVRDFVFTGSEQTYVVPSWTNAMNVTLEGAQGGSHFAGNTNYGGKLTATIAVTPGETLSLWIGEQPTGLAGGFNGGGPGDNGGRGGGGATDIRRGGNTIAHRILVAGGGGGAGFWDGSGTEVVGGKGGGLAGEAGYRVGSSANEPGGQGGTQSASGTGTCVTFNNPSVSGGLGFGGSAAQGCGCNGYGGGGGYWGGAASGNCRGGGGGSGYALPSATNVVHTAGGAQPGHGRIRLVPAP